MKRIDFLKVLELTMLATMLIGDCVSVMAQQPPARTQVQVTPQTKPSPYGSAANAAAGMRLPSGTITGFVYWQMNVFQPQADCQGLTVKIVTVTKSGMPLQLLSTTSTLTANGPMTDDSAQGTPKYMLCSYSFQNIPEDVSLRALLYGPPTTTSVPTPPAFQIPGGNCNSGPSSTLSFILTGGPMLCGHGAYNINFKLTGSASGIERSPEKSTLIPNAGGPPHGLLEQPAARNSNVSSPTSGVTGGSPLLSSASGVGSPTASQSNNGALPKNGGQVSAGATDLERQSAAGTTPGATRQTLTNADVLKMLKGGVPESVIVSSIRSANHNFDFSPAGCRELQSANVTRQVLDAMGDGSVGPCPTIRGNAEKPAGVRNVVVKLGPPKALEKVSNPRLAQQHAEIIAVLEQQRQVTNRELAAIKVNVRAPAPGTATPATVLSATPQGSVPPGALAPVAAQGSSANPSSVISHEPQFNTLVLTCSTDPTARLLRVNGGQEPNIFTPEAKYNHYIIAGCSFGEAPGTAHLFAPSGFTANLNIDSWSDNVIVAHLDPWLAGWLDQDNVTLVVNAVGKPLVQKQGFKFYAARGMPAPDGSDQEVELAYDSLPRSSVTLLNESTAWFGAQRLQPLNFGVGYDQLPWNAVSHFPSVSFEGATVAGWVFRYAYGHSDDLLGDCYINDMHYTSQGDPGSMCSSYFSYLYYATSGGVDTWAFHLASGFEISSYQLHYEEVDPRSLCGAWDDASRKNGRVGTWTYDLGLGPNNVIMVNWPFYYCTDIEAMLPNRTNAQYQSAYGLSIWVLGPRCIDLWTAKPDQSCVSNVKRILG
jgi:hypothetical protein